MTSRLLHSPPHRTTLSLICVAMLAACGGGGGESSEAGSPRTVEKGVNGSYLFVSQPDFYFGTHGVGTVATQNIELVNRGADRYPVRSVTVTGPNAEEFVTEIHRDVTLEPAQALTVAVSFAPISDGRKFASLDIDFDTIAQVSDEVNQAEQQYYRAKSLENDGYYDDSLNTYSDYIASKPVTINKQRAAIRMPIIQELSTYGEGRDASLYLSALDARDKADYDRAIGDLDALTTLYGDSHLADDARYLKAYIQLIDLDQPAMALTSLKSLRSRWPDTSYYDTALYSEAMAQQQLGRDSIARSIYEDLKYRHTGIDALGITLPKDNLTSRLWFERAEHGLDSLG